ncbi:MAG: PGF-pre-PGF domain-containing protein [Anaerolineales bacterium]|nr:PGF-pre-PGF domain-containing protein [Anaerolineales bacterium]
MKFGIFILFLFIGVTGSYTAQAVNVPLNISLLNLHAGQTFDVNMTIDPLGIEIAGAQMNLEFNKSVLNVNSIKEGNLFKQNGASTLFNNGTIDNSYGTVLNFYSFILGQTNVTTQGTFITINATAIDASNITWINVSNVKIIDPSGNFMALNTPSPTPALSSESSSGGGGGGGGGGGTSGENFSNIENKEKYYFYIYKDLTTTYLFKNTDPIISVNITGNNNAGEINVAVEVLRNTSALVIYPAPYTVFRNINIWVGTSGFATSKNIKHAEIIFRVPRSWIGSNGIDQDSITMMHYNCAWESLATKKISETSEWAYYEANATSFSTFAITGNISEGGSLSWIPLATGSNGQKEGSTNIEENENSAPETSGNVIKYLIFGAFVGIALNAALIVQTRKNKERDIFKK